MVLFAVFMTILSSRINAHLCNFIVWFIVNLQRKNKQLGIAAVIYTFIQNSLQIKCSADLFVIRRPT
jgi:hypothetical protein